VSERFEPKFVFGIGSNGRLGKDAGGEQTEPQELSGCSDPTIRFLVGPQWL